MEAFYKLLKETGSIAEFDEELWMLMVRKVVVEENGKINFALHPIGKEVYGAS